MQGSMGTWCLVNCSLLLLLASGLDAQVERFRYSGFNGQSKIPPLVAVTAASKAVCAVMCEQLAVCNSFSFHARAENCSLFSRRIMPLDVDLTIPSEDAHFFRVTDSCPTERNYSPVPGTSLCIRISNTYKPWPMAAEECAEDGGHLLVIKNDAVMQKLLAFLPRGYYLVGFNDIDTEDYHVWVDGTPVDRAMFYATEPNDSGNENGEDCGILEVKTTADGLHDFFCSVSDYFLCSLPTEE